MTETNLYIKRLLESNALRESVLCMAIQALQLPSGSRGLDVGCGIGLQTELLANAIGAEGHVTGLDVLPELIEYGRNRVAQKGLWGRVSFQNGDMNHLPFTDNSFDWVWSADCVGYPAGDFLPILRELRRVVRPGGKVVILSWSSQQLLPGYSLLEARLNGTCSSYSPYLIGKDPESHFLRGSRWFQEVGLDDVKVQTFVGDIQAPLDMSKRIALTSLFEMLWGQPQVGISPEDWSAYQRLCSPESEEFILNIPGYYAFFTYTMLSGVIPSQIS